MISSESDGMSLPAKRSACTLEEWNDESMKVACLKREAQLEPVMRRGAQEAISECQRLFKVEKWNCSVNRRDRTIFGRSVVGGKRERERETRSRMSRRCLGFSS